MPVLLNVRHEKYAQERFRGLSPFKAAQVAGFSRNSVAQLRKRADILARIEELHGAPVGRGTLIRMWQDALQRAVDAKDIVSEQKCLRQITILSGFTPKSVDGNLAIRPPRADAPATMKRHKDKKARLAAEAAAAAYEEPDNDGDADLPTAPDVSTLDSLLGRLDNDTRNIAKAEEGGHAASEPEADARSDYRNN